MPPISLPQKSHSESDYLNHRNRAGKIVRIAIVQMQLFKNLFEKVRLFENKVVIVQKSKQTFFGNYLVPNLHLVP